MKNLKSFKPLFLGFFLFSLYMLCDLDSQAKDIRFLSNKEKEENSSSSFNRFLVGSIPAEVKEEVNRFLKKKTALAEEASPSFNRFLVGSVPAEVNKEEANRFLVKAEAEKKAPEFSYPAAANLYDWAEILQLQKTSGGFGVFSNALALPLNTKKEKSATPSVAEAKFVPLSNTNSWAFSSKQLTVLEAWATNNGKYLLLEKVEADYGPWIEEIAERYKVDADLMKALCTHESGGYPNALSSSGAMGLMQLMPITCRHYDVSDPWDPYQNLEGAAKILADLPNWGFETLPDVVFAYGWGVGKARRYLNRGHLSLDQRGVQEVLFLYDVIRKED